MSPGTSAPAPSFLRLLLPWHRLGWPQSAALGMRVAVDGAADRDRCPVPVPTPTAPKAQTKPNSSPAKRRHFPLPRIGSLCAVAVRAHGHRGRHVDCRYTLTGCLCDGHQHPHATVRCKSSSASNDRASRALPLRSTSGCCSAHEPMHPPPPLRGRHAAHAVSTACGACSTSIVSLACCCTATSVIGVVTAPSAAPRGVSALCLPCATAAPPKSVFTTT